MSPRAVRAHRISEVIEASDLLVAQRLAGHAQVTTTAHYDRRDIQSLETVVASISPSSSPRLRLVTEQTG